MELIYITVSSEEKVVSPNTIPRRVASPRPTYSGPSPVPLSEAAMHLWGDAEAGEVADWIYVSNERIHHLMFGLAPGRAFVHSDANRTIFAADEVLYVLAGTMIIANPEVGEVHHVKEGQAVFFRRDTWHHAFAFGPDPLRVVEFFAPPPAAGASSDYARTKELLGESRYRDARFLGAWPLLRDQRDAARTIMPARDDDALLWELLGPDGSALAGLYCNTEHLTAGRLHLRPGGRTGVRQHEGDLVLHVLAGPLYVLLPDGDGPEGRRWFELAASDGFFVPGGCRYELRNLTASEVLTLFAVAPTY
ncbi:MAG: cupin domain-containing protein [Acidimicrobiales bacterium]